MCDSVTDVTEKSLVDKLFMLYIRARGRVYAKMRIRVYVKENAVTSVTVTGEKVPESRMNTGFFSCDRRRDSGMFVSEVELQALHLQF